LNICICICSKPLGGKLKKSIRIAALVAAATLAAGALVAPTANAATKKVKAAIAYDIGGRGDKSFNDSAAAGLDMAKKKFGATVKEVTVTQGTDSEREDKLRLLAKAGYTPIVAVGYLYAGPLKKVAAEFPKTQFAIIDDESVALPNVSSLVFTEEQGSYLVGVAAALQSVTGEVGYIGGVRTPLLQKFEAGFVAGVKATDKSATVDVKYISEPPDYSGFNDPAKAKVIANGMIDKGVDVIYTAAGGSGAGTFAAATDAAKYGNKIWTIGVDSDQYLTASAAEKKNMLTSMLKRVDSAVFDVIAAASAGKKVNDALGGGVVGRRYSLKINGIGVSYSGGYIKQYKAKIDAAAKAIMAGKIKVPTKPAK
jgi:basic membrane protein A